MSEQIELPKFDKIYKALDHCVENNVFTQISRLFTNNECGRCVNGVIISYFNGYDFLASEVREKIPKVTNNKVRYIYSYDCLLGVDKLDKKQVKEAIKKEYYKLGVVDANVLAELNNIYDWTFKDFANLFRELDI